MTYRMLVALLVLSATACAAPSGFNRWDKSLPHVDLIHGNSVDEIVSGIHRQFYYRSDLVDEWFIPKHKGRLGYQGDCEDFALLVAAHLKMVGIKTKIVVLSRAKPNYSTNKPAVARHAVLLLPDGRYIDNRHNAPFSALGKYRVEWTSNYL